MAVVPAEFLFFREVAVYPSRHPSGVFGIGMTGFLHSRLAADAPTPVPESSLRLVDRVFYLTRDDLQGLRAVIDEALEQDSGQ